MRAYVITGDLDEADTHVKPEPIAVTSSRKTAIETCEEYLGRTGGQDVIEWGAKDKHRGYARKGEQLVTYKMFFVNSVETDE